MLWKSKADIALDNLIEALRAENIYLRTLISDLQSQLSAQSQTFSLERKELMDRINNLIAPLPKNKPQIQLQPYIPIYPGYRPDLDEASDLISPVE